MTTLHSLAIAGTLCFIVGILVAIAFFTLAERKVMAAVQRRVGPNVVGLWGLLQPIIDGVKLVFKEVIVPYHASQLLFLISPIISLSLSFWSWSVVPFPSLTILVNTKYTLLYLYALSSFSVYGLVLAGWASKSRYALLGALRAVAQMISYELSISLVFLTLALIGNTFNLIDIQLYQGVCGFLYMGCTGLAFIFFICMLAETNRAPFDLPEAEAELVAGYNVEYSAVTFAMFFLAEYGNMLLMSSVLIILFFYSACYSPFTLFFFIFKILIVAFFYIIVRSAFPRYRYDQLMSIGWKLFLPLTTIFFVLVLVLVLTLGLGLEPDSAAVLSDSGVTSDSNLWVMLFARYAFCCQGALLVVVTTVTQALLWGPLVMLFY